MKFEMTSRINNRLSLISDRCDNFISRENLGSVVQLEYEPCHKIFHFGILRNISLPNFIVHVKTWIINKLQLTISIDQINLLAMLNGSLLKVGDHFQHMSELRNVYFYKITPTIETNDFYPRYIPRKSLQEVENNQRQLFKPPTGFYIYYFECIFKMGDHKRKYNIMETWTLDEFIRNILEWFIQDCRLDRTKQYEIITLERRVLPLHHSSQRIKNILLSHPNLFPAFYIREKEDIIINIPIPTNIMTIITPIITPIIQVIPTMEECCVCLEMIPNNRVNQPFSRCSHVLCSGCNYECIRTRNITCPLCRGPRGARINN